MSQIIEYKATEPIELSELSKEHRTAIIAHANYDNIDRKGDISRRGMFNKSWSETKAEELRFDIDHDRNRQPGKVVSTFENEKKAFTKVSFSNSTLGNDTLIMMDEGIIRGASFEFITEKKGELNIKGRKIRELKEVRHLATTVTYGIPPINDLAGVVSVTKALDMAAEYKALIEKLENFCRNTTATDETILGIQAEIKAARLLMSSFDTAFTRVAPEPDASTGDNGFYKQLLLLNASM